MNEKRENKNLNTLHLLLQDAITPFIMVKEKTAVLTAIGSKNMM